jgi:hypothetical protein
VDLGRTELRSARHLPHEKPAHPPVLPVDGLQDRPAGGVRVKGHHACVSFGLQMKDLAIEDLADEVGWTRQHLTSGSGFPRKPRPTSPVRVVPIQPWAQIAMACGYTD